MIIDCHCHAGEGDGLTGPWDTRAPLTKYLKWAQQAGIGHTVLFPAFHSDYQAANREVARIVGRDRTRFSGFAFVHPARDAGRVESMVSELVLRHGFCGIKVHRYDARITREICRVARKLRLPILYDVMGEVASVDLLAAEYPGVEFIIPHLGSFTDDWRAQRALPGRRALPGLVPEPLRCRRRKGLERQRSSAWTSSSRFLSCIAGNSPEIRGLAGP